MNKDGGDGAIKSTTEARQGSRNKTNLHALLIALALLAVIGAGLYTYFLSNSPVPTVPGTGAPPTADTQTNSPVR